MENLKAKYQEFVDRWEPDLSHRAELRVLFNSDLHALIEAVAEEQKAMCVEHYYNSDNTGGTLHTIASTPLATSHLTK